MLIYTIVGEEYSEENTGEFSYYGVVAAYTDKSKAEARLKFAEKTHEEGYDGFKILESNLLEV